MGVLVKFVAVESNATNAPPSETAECVLGPLPGEAPFAEIARGNPLEPGAAVTMKFVTAVPPLVASGFDTVTLTLPAVATLLAGTFTTTLHAVAELQVTGPAGISAGFVLGPKFT